MNKIMSTEQLRALCNRANDLKFANGPNATFWKEVERWGRHVIVLAFRHSPSLRMWEGVDHGFNFEHNNGVNVRALVACQMKKGTQATILCDFDEEQYLAFGFPLIDLEPALEAVGK